MKKCFIIAAIVLAITASAFTVVIAAQTGDMVDNRPGAVTNVAARYNQDIIYVKWNYSGKKDGVTVYFYGKAKNGKDVVFNWVVSTQNNYLILGRPEIKKIDYVTVVAYEVDGSTVKESFPSRPVKPVWTWKALQ